MKAKGAVRNKQVKRNLDGANWFRYLKPVSIAITVACILLSLILLLLQLMNKDVNKLQLTAPLEHVSESLITDTLLGVYPNGFMYLDVKEVSDRLTALPMIAQVDVEKIWPDTLKIIVTEEHPVATWNNENMLSQQGEILPLALAQLQLPQLKGSKGESRFVMQHFQLFNRWGRRHKLHLESLKSTSSSWLLQFDDGLDIWLSSAQAMKGLKQLESVLHQFKIERVRRIDMRYEQGFAVAWKDQARVQG